MKKFHKINPIIETYPDRPELYSQKLVNKILKTFFSSKAKSYFIDRGLDETFLIIDGEKEVILKIFNEQYKDELDIYTLKKASDLKLIPKILSLTPDYYIMEFIKGTDLRKLIKKKEIGPALANYLVDEIENELNKWHDAGLAHRDVAFKNILLSTKGKVWIIDPEVYNKFNSKHLEKEKYRDWKDFEGLKQDLYELNKKDDEYEIRK